MIISSTELERILDESNTVIIDTRSFKEYSDNHIPGSVNLDLFSLHWLDTSSEGIISYNQQMQKIFSFAGVDDTKKVIFYDNISGMLAARGVWMLLYFSHNDVFMLDGGIKKWKEEKKPIETKLNGFTPTNFLAKPNPEILSGFEYINDNLNDVTILDVRSIEEFDGSLLRAARGGHIPNAIHINWNQNITKDGTWKNSEELTKLYNIPKDFEIITYCQGAYRAAHTFVALKKLGFENVKVYLGSWGEWGNKLELPIEK